MNHKSSILLILSIHLAWLGCDSLCHRLCLDKITRVKTLKTIRAMLETWCIDNIYIYIWYGLPSFIPWRESLCWVHESLWMGWQIKKAWWSHPKCSPLFLLRGAETKVEKSGPVPPPSALGARIQRTSGDWWWWWWWWRWWWWWWVMGIKIQGWHFSSSWRCGSRNPRCDRTATPRCSTC